MAGRGEPGAVRGFDRHRRALAKGAIEDEAPARRARQLVEQSAWAEIHREIRVRRVKRARYDAVLLAFARLAQIDERHLGRSQEVVRLGSGNGPAAACDFLLRQADVK